MCSDVTATAYVEAAALIKNIPGNLRKITHVIHTLATNARKYEEIKIYYSTEI
jgi:hypothetical protein